MASELLLDRDKLAVVEFTKQDHWLRLAIWLAGEFTGGDLARFAPQAMVSVDGIDALSTSYTRSNWASGVTSGALYAFRSLHIARQQLVIAELAGRLLASDMSAIASAAAIAVSSLARKELPASPNEGWSIQARVIDRSPSEAAGDNGVVERAH